MNNNNNNLVKRKELNDKLPEIEAKRYMKKLENELKEAINRVRQMGITADNHITFLNTIDRTFALNEPAPVERMRRDLEHARNGFIRTMGDLTYRPTVSESLSWEDPALAGLLNNHKIWENRNMKDMEEARKLLALVDNTRNYLDSKYRSPEWRAATHEARQQEQQLRLLAAFAGNTQDGNRRYIGGRKRRTRRKRKRRKRRKTKKKRTRKKRRRRRKRTKKTR